MTLQRDLLIGGQRFLGIREGMVVYDLDNHKIGKVKQLYFGASSGRANSLGLGAATASNPDKLEEDTFAEELAEAFPDDGRFPEPLRQRMLYDGFVRLDSTGLFSADRYVLPDQIDNVTDDRINLNVVKDELIKG